MEAHRLDAHVGAAGDELLQRVLHLGAFRKASGKRYYCVGMFRQVPFGAPDEGLTPRTVAMHEYARIACTVGD